MPGSYMFPSTMQTGLPVYVANAAARAAAIPEKIGQMLFQSDTKVFYVASALTVGAWALQPHFADTVITRGVQILSEDGLTIFESGAIYIVDALQGEIGSHVVAISAQSGGDAQITIPITTGTVEIIP